MHSKVLPILESVAKTAPVIIGACRTRMHIYSTQIPPLRPDCLISVALAISSMRRYGIWPIVAYLFHLQYRLFPISTTSSSSCWLPRQ